MVARATLADIDTVRMSVAEAVELFENRCSRTCTSSPATTAVRVLLRPRARRSS